VPDAVIRAYGLTELHFGREYIIPKPLDPRVLMWVAPAVAQAAMDDRRGPTHSSIWKPIIDMLAARMGKGAAGDAHVGTQGAQATQARCLR
jgi:malate dehydrogenase (oxaloacetate-decarboxylating)(NADP+)